MYSLTRMSSALLALAEFSASVVALARSCAFARFKKTSAAFSPPTTESFHSTFSVSATGTAFGLHLLHAKVVHTTLHPVVDRHVPADSLDQTVAWIGYREGHVSVFVEPDRVNHTMDERIVKRAPWTCVDLVPSPVLHYLSDPLGHGWVRSAYVFLSGTFACIRASVLASPFSQALAVCAGEVSAEGSALVVSVTVLWLASAGR